MSWITQIHHRQALQRRSARINLHRAIAGQLADDDTLRATESAGKPTSRKRDATLVGVAEGCELGGAHRPANPLTLVYRRVKLGRIVGPRHQ